MEEEEPLDGLPLHLRHVEEVALGGVDDGGLAALADAGQPAVIGQMDVPVDEPAGLQLIQQVIEAGKALVSAGPQVGVLGNRLSD